MNTKITLALLTALLACPDARALPSFEGKDEKGNPCAAVAAADGTVTFRTGTGYTFGQIPLTPEPHRLLIDALTIQRSGSYYSPPIGAPITFGNIGLIRLKGAIVLGPDSQITHWVLTATGGLANWWRHSFFCGGNGVER